jgi:hypothetical protein
MLASRFCTSIHGTETYDYWRVCAPANKEPRAGGGRKLAFDHRPIWLLGDTPLRHVKSGTSIESLDRLLGFPSVG